ncbi:MAG TPA: GGDEF domain-containing protein, partial [Actinoplanes sp.]
MQPTALARLPGRAIPLCVAVLAIIVLVAGAVGGLAGRTALAIGVGGTALWAAAALARVAFLTRRRAARQAGADDLAGSDDPAGADDLACARDLADRDPGAWRGAGYLGLAAAAAGLTASVPLRAPSQPGAWATAGFGLVAALYSIGTLLLTGSRTRTGRGWARHLRRAFDGASLGLSLAFAGYLIPFVQSQELATLPVALIGATGIAIIAVTVVRGRPRDWAAVRCGAGAATVLAGLGVLVTMTTHGSYGMVGPLLGIPIVLGLAATVDGGARRGARPAPAEPRYPDQYLASYPLLGVPAGVGVIAASWHLIASGGFDITGSVLGIAMVAVLAMRELLVVRDLRRYAGQLRTAEAHFRSLVAGATDLTLVLDDRLTVGWQSPAAARIFGLADAQVVGRPFTDM